MLTMNYDPESPQSPHEQTEIEKKQAVFRDSFEEIMNTNQPGWIENSKIKSIRIITVGAGGAVETGPLRALFPHSFIAVLDIEDQLIAQGIAETLDISNIDFIQADASIKETWKNPLLQAPFDLVVIRNPNVLEMDAAGNWKRILENMETILAPHGILYISTGNDTNRLEEEEVEKLLKKTEFSFTSYQNPVLIENREILPYKEPTIFVAKLS